MKVKELIQELIKLNLEGYGESEVIIDSDSCADPNHNKVNNLTVIRGEIIINY